MSFKEVAAVIRWFGALVALLFLAVQPAAAAPPAPVPVSPAGGASVAVPTFSWQAAAGAAKYEVEVGPRSDPNAVSWSGRTANLTLTPISAAKFAGGQYYWRVRARDRSDAPGPWSEKAPFTLSIPVPSTALAFSGEPPGQAPVLEWRLPAGRPASYKVEVSASPAFAPVEATYTTYNERLTPVSTLAFGTHIYRVSGLDAAGHPGAPSAGRKFTVGIGAPALLKPAADAAVAVPELEWAAAEGAASYKIEVSDSATFAPVKATYTTYLLRITPVRALPPGVTYWRVSGVDAGGHVGVPSAAPTTPSSPPAKS
jgi:hypothetical protein